MSLQQFCERPPITVSPAQPIREACQLLQDKNIGCLVVVDNGTLWLTRLLIATKDPSAPSPSSTARASNVAPEVEQVLTEAVKKLLDANR